MTEGTGTYCGHCKRYIGKGEIPQCPYCGAVFNMKEDLGTLVRTYVATKVDTKIDTRPLKLFTIYSVGGGVVVVGTAFALSSFSQEWAAFFSSLLTSFKWQFLVTTIFFSCFCVALRLLFWEKLDEFFLYRRGNWTLFKFIRACRRFLAPLERSWRLTLSLFMVISSILALPFLWLKFKQPPDYYEYGFAVVTNILWPVTLSIVGGFINQLIQRKKAKEQVSQGGDFAQPPTIDAFKSDPGYRPPGDYRT